MSELVQNTDIQWVCLQEMIGNMIDAAKESDWEKMAELDNARQPMLENYFTHIAPTLSVEVLRDRIHVLQAMEEQILHYSQSLREDVVGQLKSLHKGKQVEQAYSAYATA